MSTQHSRTSHTSSPRLATLPALPSFPARRSSALEPEKLLVVAYWFQVVQGTGELESQLLNQEFKSLDHSLVTITRAVCSLAETTPRSVMQTRKTGSTKQARKRFRLTVERIRRAGR